MTAQPHEPLTQAEFPAWEERQALKHEFVDGHVYGFAGGTQIHSAIASLMIQAIGPAVRPCRTFGTDMLIEMATSTRYADVVVTCDDRDNEPHSRVLRFPKLIVEVLSESTAKDDLGPKMREYQTIQTMQEYVVIDSRKRWVQVAWRQGESGSWALDAPLTGGVLTLPITGVAVHLDEVYEFARGPASRSI